MTESLVAVQGSECPSICDFNSLYYTRRQPGPESLLIRAGQLPFYALRQARPPSILSSASLHLTAIVRSLPAHISSSVAGGGDFPKILRTFSPRCLLSQRGLLRPRSLRRIRPGPHSVEDLRCSSAAQWVMALHSEATMHAKAAQGSGTQTRSSPPAVTAILSPSQFSDGHHR